MSTAVLRATSLQTAEYERGRDWAKAFLAASEAVVCGDGDVVAQMIAECKRIRGVGDLVEVITGEFGCGVMDQVAFDYRRAFEPDV